MREIRYFYLPLECSSIFLNIWIKVMKSEIPKTLNISKQLSFFQKLNNLGHANIFLCFYSQKSKQNVRNKNSNQPLSNQEKRNRQSKSHKHGVLNASNVNNLFASIYFFRGILLLISVLTRFVPFNEQFTANGFRASLNKKKHYDEP